MTHAFGIKFVLEAPHAFDYEHEHRLGAEPDHGVRKIAPSVKLEHACTCLRIDDFLRRATIPLS